jgi:O-6-methylguanine DNA methyltransferase
MTKIGLATLHIHPNRWLALALDEKDNKLVACTSNNIEQKAVLDLKGALRRLNRLPDLDETLQSPYSAQVAEKLSLLIQGKEYPFGFHEISITGWSKPRIEISRQLIQVPKGKVISYGGLAKLANSSPRGVGSVMRTNPVPWAVPCHRVIHSDGRLGKLGGTVAGTKEKARILQAEGVPFTANGRVNEKAILL